MTDRHDLEAACRRLVAELAAIHFALGDTFACSFCGAEPDEASWDETAAEYRNRPHADDCLWRQAVELTARMAPGYDADEQRRREVLGLAGGYGTKEG